LWARRAKWNELAVKTLSLQSYTWFKQRDISETLDFFRCGLWNKKCFIFYHINNTRDEIPAHPGLEKNNRFRENPLKSIIAGSKRAGPGRAWLGQFIMNADHMAKKKLFLFHKPHRKIKKLPRYNVFCNPVLNCENELMTASSFLFDPCRTQLSHRRAKFITVTNSKLWLVDCDRIRQKPFTLHPLYFYTSNRGA